MGSKNSKDILCIDIGGTSIKSAVINDSQLYNLNKNKTPKNYLDFLKLIKNLIKKESTEFNIKGVAISTPGIINKTKNRIDGVSAISYIHNKYFLSNLQKEINLPISVENDANCAGIAEISQKQKYKNIVVIVIGTGIGGCIFINRKILNGHNGFAGEFGLMNYGQKRNWGWYASPVAQFNFYNLKNKTNLTGSEIFKKAINNKKIVSKVVKDLVRYWALGIYNIATVLNPEIFIIAGGISENKIISTLIKTELQKLKKGIKAFNIKVENAKFSNNSNLIGAYLVYCKVNKFNLKDIGFLDDETKF